MFLETKCGYLSEVVVVITQCNPISNLTWIVFTNTNIKLNKILQIGLNQNILLNPDVGL
jgi:hypothetical protein